MPRLPAQYQGGLGDAGAAALKAFVQAGGTVVTLNNASQVYARKKSADVSNVLQGIKNTEFYVPGSILQVAVDTANPIGFGATKSRPFPVFFENSPSFKVSGHAISVAHYTSENPLLSGWLLGRKISEGDLGDRRGTGRQRTDRSLRVPTPGPRAVGSHL